jgi:hypothetical protein
MERNERHVTNLKRGAGCVRALHRPLPDTSLAVAQTKGHERYEGYIEALGRCLARGRKLSDEVVCDVSQSVEQRGRP